MQNSSRSEVHVLDSILSLPSSRLSAAEIFSTFSKLTSDQSNFLLKIDARENAILLSDEARWWWVFKLLLHSKWNEFHVRQCLYTIIIIPSSEYVCDWRNCSLVRQPPMAQVGREKWAQFNFISTSYSLLFLSAQHESTCPRSLLSLADFRFHISHTKQHHTQPSEWSSPTPLAVVFQSKGRQSKLRM